MTPKQLLRWHIVEAWSPKRAIEFPCKMCKVERRSKYHPFKKGRDVFDQHGWMAICEPCFRKLRATIAARDKKERARAEYPQ